MDDDNRARRGRSPFKSLFDSNWTTGNLKWNHNHTEHTLSRAWHSGFFNKNSTTSAEWSLVHLNNGSRKSWSSLLNQSDFVMDMLPQATSEERSSSMRHTLELHNLVLALIWGSVFFVIFMLLNRYSVSIQKAFNLFCFG
jgi:hypothetical protein